MELNELKLLAGDKVNVMENVSTSAKKQMLRYIKEADETEVKSFLLDGEVSTITEDSKPIIETRFNNNQSKIISEGVGDIVGGFFKNAASDVAKNAEKAAQQGAVGIESVLNKMTSKLVKASGATPDDVRKSSLGHFEKLVKKFGLDNETVNKFSKAVNNLISKLQEHGEKVSDLSQWQHAPVFAAGIGIAAFTALIYGFVKKKQGKDEAQKKVEEALEKKKKLNSKQRKAAEIVSDAYGL